MKTECGIILICLNKINMENYNDNNEDNIFMAVKGEYDGKYFYITMDLAKQIYLKYKKEKKNK